MGKLNIDYNRGVIKKATPDHGIEVYMYIDEPGVFLNAFGTQVHTSLAEHAGFDIVLLGKERLKRERMAIARKSIEDELELPEYTIVEKEIIAERGGFVIVHIGLGRHIVEDPDGGKLVENPLTLEEAKIVLDQMVPQETTPEPVKVKKPAPSPAKSPFVKSMAEAV